MNSREGLRLVMRRFRQKLRIEKEVRRFGRSHGGGVPDSVVIVSYSGNRVEVKNPAGWLKLFADCYGAFKGDDVLPAIKEWCDGCKSATVAAELNGITHRVFYERSKIFFGFALGLAVERKIVRF